MAATGAAPSHLSVDCPQPPILDEKHLRGMTLGDATLEREVLEIFVRQATLSLGRIVGAEPAIAAAAAHTLKGSARGIGAWRVADAAERLEQAAQGQGETAMAAAIRKLQAASLEACATIGALLARPAGTQPAARARDH
jgi:HPt (histidine-containing phosphotransfer) domain-containing protein